jgi:hypothetical protein
MNKEKQLIVALAAMVEIVKNRVKEMSSEEELALMNAVELLVQASQNCDDCVDY